MRTRLSRDRVGDETLPLVRSRGMRACLSWDRVEMNPASREIELRPIVFPAPFRQGSSVQLRVLQRLGSSVRRNASFGTVAGTSEPVALKSPGAGSSLLSSKGFSATAGPAKFTDSHRQHVCGFIHKSLRESGGGSVRQSENTHCLLFFTPRWHHADQQLARMHFLRSRNVTAGVMRDQGGASIRDTHRPESSLGSQTWRNCWRHRLAVPRQEIYASQVEPETIEPSCVIASGVSERGALQSRTLMGARKPCTKRLYASNGSVCEGVRLISTWLLAPYVLSSRCTDWIVDRYHRHWSLCRGHRISSQGFTSWTLSP